MLSFASSYRGQRVIRGRDENGQESTLGPAVPGSSRTRETPPGTPEQLSEDPQRLAQSPGSMAQSPVAARVTSGGPGQNAASIDASFWGVSPVVPPSPVMNGRAQTHGFPLEKLVEEYRQALDGLDGLVGDALRQASRRCFVISDRIDREFPGFDWPSLWREILGPEGKGEVSVE